jgi:ATP-dependent Zn protease
MKQSYSEAIEILRTNRASLDDVIQGLMQKGTLTGPELREILERHGAMISPTKQKNVLKTSAVL